MKIRKIHLLAAIIFLAAFVAGCSSSDLSAGTPVAGKKDTGAVQEEGQISLDRNFYLIFDGSGSMSESKYAGTFKSKIDGAKWAAKEFVTKSVPADVNLGLYAFDSRGNKERVALGQGNRDKIIAQIELMQSGGNTPLNEAIKKGVNVLAKQRNSQLGYGEYYLIVVTDGEATDGDTKDSVAYAQKDSINIITIGFGLSQTHPLAKDSLSYRNATNPDELLQALQATQGESTYYDSSAFNK